jgi:predicted RNA-binding Zn ribbon-like protein
LRRLGGHPALDYVNTVDNDFAEPETLTSYARLLSWCVESAILSRRESERLRRLANRHPRRAQFWLSEALRVRRLAGKLCAAQAGNRRARGVDIAAFNETVMRLSPLPLLAIGVRHRATNVARTGEAQLSEPAKRLVQLITAFVGSPDFSHVGRCEADNCGWFFIDRSPSKRRRWCSMEGCGNRAKARRHYSRTRRARKSGTRSSD